MHTDLDMLHIDTVTLPPWASGFADGNYIRIGAALATRDGRRCGNAFVNRLSERYCEVITDAGTALKLTFCEMQELFYPPQFVMAASPDWLRGRVPGLFDE